MFLSIIFCGSNQYQEELAINADALFGEISSFEDTNRDLDEQ